jgi:3-hydroxyacyl-CoA dehydrogenase
MMEKELAVDDLDAIIGKAVGRPGSSIFGTLDLVGLDVGYHVMNNLYDAVPDDEMRVYFGPSDFMKQMMEKKWLGNKTRQGFYKRTKDEKGGKIKLVLDYRTMEYRPAGKPKFESVSAAKKTEGDMAARLKPFFQGKDAAAEVIRDTCPELHLRRQPDPEIADNIVAITTP